MKIIKEKKKLSADEVYRLVLKHKSAREKIKLADDLFDFAKKINPKAFQWLKLLKNR